MNKRGVSQVIGVVLMIVLSVVAIGVFFGFIKNYMDKETQSIATEMECVESSYKLRRACYNSTLHEINFVIENNKVEHPEKKLVAIIDFENETLDVHKSAGWEFGNCSCKDVRETYESYGDDISIPGKLEIKRYNINTFQSDLIGLEPKEIKIYVVLSKDKKCGPVSTSKIFEC